MTSKGKRKLENPALFKDDPGLIQEADQDSGAESDDSTDSEESEYSGLEESDSEVESESSLMSLEDEDEDDRSGNSAASDDDGDDDKDSLSGSEGELGTNEKHAAPSRSHKNVKGPSAQKSSLRKKTPTYSAQYTKGTSVPTRDEYEQDSSDEEDIRNTVGNIPMEWYRDYDHLGYDLTGQKIGKPKTGDELDTFIKKMDDPNYWRSVKDKATGQDVILSDKDVEVIQRLRKGKYVDTNYNPFAPWVDFFTHEKMIHPLSNRPADKRSFIPSRLEALKVGKMVHAIKMGWLKPKQPQPDEDQPNYYMLWTDDDQTDWSKRLRHHIPAPKMILPGHAESYNPPAEYLFTEEEELAWKDKEPDERRQNFIPQKYDTLRRVPAYKNFIKERFERCLDLYLCPRQRKMRMNVDPEDLIPKLPKPKDLQPFPTTQSIVYRGHTALVRCICVDPSGQWLVSGSDDETVKLWEISTGRCMKTYSMGGTVRDVAWNPNTGLSLIAVAVDNTAVILNPELGDKLISSSTDNILSSYEPQETEKKTQIEWQECEGPELKTGLRLKVVHPKNINQVTWHAKGDYLATLMPQGQNQSVCIHQLSKRRSQHPFTKSKGLVQSILFHPIRPFLFVATQRYVRVYNLLKQELTKKLMTNVKWVSSMAVHPGGDNLIVGSYDSKLSWFDLDLSTKPYQTLRHHKKALRQVSYHKKYPLFASASDDGTVIVCHGMVYSDLLQNPLIVPVKILRGHEPSKELGVLDCVFHPTQPWLFSSGCDSTIRLYT